MSFSSFFARIVALVGGAMIMLRRWDGPQQQPVFGVAPAIPKAVPQNIPDPQDADGPGLAGR